MARWPTRPDQRRANGRSGAAPPVSRPADAPSLRSIRHPVHAATVPAGRRPLHILRSRQREMDATDRHDERDHRAPLYDQRFEHDACGVGFVADAGGGSHTRVLPLALAGLAALAHRGAFAADGESSDGAGVAMPLSGSLLSLVAGARAAERPGVVMLFLPRGRVATRAGASACGAGFSRMPVCRSFAGDPFRSSRGRSGRLPRCRVRPWSRRSSRGRSARRTRCSNVGWSSLGGVWRQPRERQAVRSPGCRCHLHRAGPSSTRAWSRGRD